MNFKSREHIPTKMYLDCKITILSQAWSSFNLKLSAFPSFFFIGFTMSTVNVNKESTFIGTEYKMFYILGKDLTVWVLVPSGNFPQDTTACEEPNAVICSEKTLEHSCWVTLRHTWDLQQFWFK